MGANVRARQASDRHRRTRIAIVGTVVLVVALTFVVVAVNGGLAGSTTSSTGDSHDGDVVDTTPASIGKPFPRFAVTDADGASVTTASPHGKPTLVWFTDSTCPDAAGVRQVADLQAQEGATPLQVVMVLVNLQEPSAELTAWRDSFA